MATEDENFKETFSVLKMLNLYDQYASSFKENDMTDEEVKFCFEKDPRELNTVIGVQGHRVRFQRFFQQLQLEKESRYFKQGEGAELLKTPEAQLDSRLYQTDQFVLESKPKHSPSVDINDPPPPYTSTEIPQSLYSDGLTATALSDATYNFRFQPNSHSSTDPWRQIADSLSLNVASQRIIRKKVVEIALDHYRRTVDEHFNRPTNITEEELKDIQSQAEDQAYCFIEDTLKGVDDESKGSINKILDDELGKSAQLLRIRNNEKRLEFEKNLDEISNKICSAFANDLNQKLGQGYVSKQAYDVSAEEGRAASMLQFRNMCEKHPMYDEAIVSDKLTVSAQQLWIQFELKNSSLEERRSEAIKKAVEKYQNLIIKCQNIDQFQHDHQISFQQGLDIIKKCNFEADFENPALKEYQKSVEKLRVDAKTILTETAAKMREECGKLVDSIPAKYRDLMKSITLSKIPIREEIVAAKYVTTKKDLLNETSDALDKLFKDIREPMEKKYEIMTQVKAKLEDTFDQIQKSNSDKWQLFESHAKEEVENIKKQYRSEMVNLSNTDEVQDFKNQESQLRARMVEEFKKRVDHQLAKEDFVNALRQTLLDAFDFEKQAAIEVFKMRQMVDEVTAKAILLDATRLYANSMDANFKARLFYDDKELRDMHEELVVKLVATTQESKLNERQKERVKEGLGNLFTRYEEENKRRSPKSDIAIGIDLGTTNCCVGVYLHDKVVIIPNFNSADEKRTVPSYLTFNNDHTIDIGQVAKQNSYRDVIHTIFDAKRLIGRKFDEDVVQEDMKCWPFDVTDKDNEPRILVRDREYRPEEISAKILYKLKKMSEEYLRREVRRAVITVPAYFNGSQRQATKDAADIAGLEAYIMNEPTAAAIAYKLNTTGELEKNVLVFDLGGGTFDVVVIRMDKGKIHVLAIGGNTHLGGRDFDQNMINEIVRRVQSKHKIDLMKGHDSTNIAEKIKARGRLRRIRDLCEQGKMNLSEKSSVNIRLDSDEFVKTNIEEKFTREEFNELNAKLFQECIKIVDTTLKDAKVRKEHVDDIVLVGGSTRIVKIQEMLKAYFGNHRELIKWIDPDEAVAAGAAYEAALRFQDDDGSFQEEADMSKRQERTPRSLGIAIFPDIMHVIIPKNTKIPCEVTKGGFTTLQDKQTVCEVRIFEGENTRVQENNLLGRFELHGIPPGRSEGQEKIQCVMKIDEEGILHVTAELVTNGKSAQLKIENYNGRMTSAEKDKANGEDLLKWCLQQPCLQCQANNNN